MSNEHTMAAPSVCVCEPLFSWVAFDDVAVGDVVILRDGTVGQKMLTQSPNNRMIRKDNGQEISLHPFASSVYVLFSPTKKGMPTIEEKIRTTIKETLLSEDFRKSFTKGLAQDIVDAKIKPETDAETKVESKAEAKPTEVPEPGEDFRLLKVGETTKVGDEYYVAHQKRWAVCPSVGCRVGSLIPYRRRTHLWRPPTNEDLKNGPVACRAKDGDHYDWIDGLLFLWDRGKFHRYYPYTVFKPSGAVANFRFCEIRVPVE